MSWPSGDEGSLFFKIKSNLGIYHVLPNTPKKLSPEYLSLTLAEKQQLTDNEQADSTKEKFFLHRTLYIDRRKVFVFFKTDTNNLYIVMYSYRKNLYIKAKKNGVEKKQDIKRSWQKDFEN